jgi:hypothetical protein
MGGLAPARIYVRPIPDYPDDKWRSTFRAHTRRNPPSREPGVDYYCPIGTVLVSIGDGYVSEVGGGIGPATGRYVKVNLDNGQSFRLLHLGPRHSLIPRGGRVRKGQPLAISGASGYGSEYFGASSPYDAQMILNTGGPHTHATLFPTHAYNNFAGLLDMEQWVVDSTTAGGNATPFAPTEPEPDPPYLEDFMITVTCPTLLNGWIFLLGVGYIKNAPGDQGHNYAHLTTGKVHTLTNDEMIAEMWNHGLQECFPTSGTAAELQAFLHSLGGGRFYVASWLRTSSPAVTVSLSDDDKAQIAARVRDGLSLPTPEQIAQAVNDDAADRMQS